MKTINNELLAENFLNALAKKQIHLYNIPNVDISKKLEISIRDLAETTDTVKAIKVQILNNLSTYTSYFKEKIKSTTYLTLFNSKDLKKLGDTENKIILPIFPYPEEYLNEQRHVKKYNETTDEKDILENLKYYINACENDILSTTISTFYLDSERNLFLKCLPYFNHINEILLLFVNKKDTLSYEICTNIIKIITKFIQLISRTLVTYPQQTNLEKTHTTFDIIVTENANNNENDNIFDGICKIVSYVLQLIMFSKDCIKETNDEKINKIFITIHQFCNKDINKLYNILIHLYQYRDNLSDKHNLIYNGKLNVLSSLTVIGHHLFTSENLILCENASIYLKYLISFRIIENLNLEWNCNDIYKNKSIFNTFRTSCRLRLSNIPIPQSLINWLKLPVHLDLHLSDLVLSTLTFNQLNSSVFVQENSIIKLSDIILILKKLDESILGDPIHDNNETSLSHSNKPFDTNKENLFFMDTIGNEVVEKINLKTLESDNNKNDLSLNTDEIVENHISKKIKINKSS